MLYHDKNIFSKRILQDAGAFPKTPAPRGTNLTLSLKKNLGLGFPSQEVILDFISEVERMNRNKILYAAPCRKSCYRKKTGYWLPQPERFFRFFFQKSKTRVTME